MSTSPDFILVDGSSYLFRAYHALPALSNSCGESTGAIVGVVSMLRRLFDTYSPSYLAVVFDTPEPTFRDRLYPAYKAQRPPLPDSLSLQIAPLHAIIRAQGLPLLCVPGVEADDVIATLATQAAEQGLQVLIATSDKDLTQIVSERIYLIDTMTEQQLDPVGVEAKFGVPPARMVDYLTLVGDKTDNLPGVPGCGAKTAVKWLNHYGSLDRLISQAAAIEGRVGANLRACVPQLSLIATLVTLKRDVALDYRPRDLIAQAPDYAVLRAAYNRLEAKRLLATLPPEPAPTIDAITVAYPIVRHWPEFLDWMARLNQTELFAFDTETTHLDPLQAELVGVSFAIASGQAAYVPLAHRYIGVPEQLDRDTVLAHLKPLLEDPQRHKVGQHIKYDLQVLARYGIHLQGIAFDTLLESYVLDASAQHHDLDYLAAHYLNYKTIKFHDVVGKGARQIGFDQAPLEQAGPYAAEDADLTLRLHQVLWPRLQAVPALAAVLLDLEMPLVPVLARLEQAGMRIDIILLKVHSLELNQRLQNLEQQAHSLAGHPFNLNSPKQISEIFFQTLGLPILEKTPGGAPSTGEAVLAQLAAEHPLPALLLEYRSLAKLKSTYLDALPAKVNPTTGRLHTSYRQAVAITGRLSSSDPNLQNIPIRGEEGRRIRQAFIAADGYLLVAADYSQIELRLMAHFSQDAGLLAAFAQGQDVHRATAAEVFGVAPEAITPDQRRAAKAINFGLIYGMSAFGLARQLGCDRNTAQAYVKRYFERYPGVQNFMTQTREQARTQGYVATLYGRRLYLPEINARPQQRRAAAERTAINAPLQGSAADLIKRAMLAVDAWLQTESVPARLILQVHDELVLEVRADQVPLVRERVATLMMAAGQLTVPLVVETGAGANWDAAH